jgi:hypothetical protein
MGHLTIPSAGILLLAASGAAAFASPAQADQPCVECLKVRVGPAIVVRGPFPDELDAAFSAIKLPDGSFRGFSANGATYAIDGASLRDMGGPRRPVLEAGVPGSVNECGRWLTATSWAGDTLIGMVHQESICDYGPQGQTDKSMAIALSSDNGVTWTDLGNVITGSDSPRPGTTSGEGDCSMVDGQDGYLYAYCLRNTDWQTIVARAPLSEPTEWRKYFEGGWSEPGLDGKATDIGFIGTGAGYLQEQGWVAAVATDPWFGGVRLSLSEDKVSFSDLDEPLLPIDGSDWNRPAETDLVAYGSLLDPATGSNIVGSDFLLSYVYVPPGEGFESRYLVYHEVALSVEDEPPAAAQVGLALTRWKDGQSYVTSTGPLTGDRLGFEHDRIVAYMLTRAPEGVASIQFAECSRNASGRMDQVIADEGSCPPQGYRQERTAGWLYAAEQVGTVPVYRCTEPETGGHFASSAPDCEGLGTREFLLGYGLAP